MAAATSSRRPEFFLRRDEFRDSAISLLGLPAGQAFVREFHFDFEFFSDASGERRRFVRHFPGFAGDVQRMAHENTRNAVFGANGAKASEVIAAVLAAENHERSSGDSEFVGKGEADAFAAVIERQNARRLVFGSC